MTDQTLQSAILDLLAQRGPGKTICPSEVARAVDPLHWRPLMDKTRAAAARLADQGVILITQHGKPVDPLQARGPIRLKMH